MKNEKQLQTIEATDLQEINNALEVLKEKLLPYLKEVTPGTKLNKAKVGSKGIGFITKVYEYSLLHPMLVPSYFEKETIRLDLERMETLRVLQAQMIMMNKLMQDSLMLLGDEAYKTSLGFYGAIKTASKNEVPGAQVVYEDLKTQFMRQGKQKKDTLKNG